MIVERMGNNDTKISTMRVGVKGMTEAIPRTIPNMTLMR
jgi:hypothetical protein